MKIARFLRPYWLRALLVPLLMILEVAMDLLQPRFTARIIDEGIGRGDFNVVLATGGWMIGAAFVGHPCTPARSMSNLTAADKNRRRNPSSDKPGAS